MKTTLKVLALLLCALWLGGCVGEAQAQQVEEYIGLDAAKALALKDAGVTEKEASFTTMGLDQRNGVDYYAVDFSAAGSRYEFEIDALTGSILDRKSFAEERITEVPVETAAVVPDGSETPSASDSRADTVGAAGASEQIGEAKAKDLALNHAGLKEEDVSFVRSRLDYDDGRLVYEVEFYTADYQEYDYEIDALTGDVLSYDYDAEGYTAPVSNGSSLTAEQAKELALAQVPGATAQDIWEFETDYDDGRLEYEGKILYNSMEYEFEIDGYSGAFRSWEAERANR